MSEDGGLLNLNSKKAKSSRPMSQSQSSEFLKMSHATFGNPGGPKLRTTNRNSSVASSG